MKIHELFKQTRHPQDVNDYYHCFNSSNVLNVIYWWTFFEIINDIKGDIVECGVGRGRSLITILAINRLKKIMNPKFTRKVFALDSFEGFPSPHKFDKSSRNPKKGEWSESPNKQFKYSVKSLKKIISLAELDSKEINIVKGFFDKTTEKLKVKKISILHLDGDLYDSVLSPLNNLWKKVSIGGIVVIDDYIVDKRLSKNEGFPGARRAINEFLKKNSNFDFKVSIRGSPYLLRIK